jgi:galactokinase
MTDFEEQVLHLRGPGTFFAADRPIHIARAPGRLDVMGGNVDYTGGLVFESTIREATWAAAQLRDDGQVVLLNPQMRDAGWLERITLPIDQLRTIETTRAHVSSSPEVRWTAYVLGVFHLLQTRWPAQAAQGITLYLHSTVPLNKGVSSSAAVEVAAMKASAAAYGIDLKGIELATACQWVENAIADSACGIMDQATSVLGEEGACLPLLCQPCQILTPVHLPAGLQIWAIDSGVKHAVSGVEYEAARAAAFIGYRTICSWEGLSIAPDPDSTIPRFSDTRFHGYLSNLSPSIFRSLYEMRLPERLTGEEILHKAETHPDPFTQIRPDVTYRVRDCTRYAVEEQQRIELFVALLRGTGSASGPDVYRLLGDLMFQSHWSYTECGLGCQETDRIVELVREEANMSSTDGALWGAKISGGGAGGTVVVLGSPEAQPAFHRVVARYAEETGIDPYIFEGSSPGADRFGIRLIGADA